MIINKPMMKSRSKIIIVPIGDLDFFQINKLAGRLSEAFTSPVDIIQGAEPPEEAYSPARLQYFSSVMLGKMERLKANDKEKILAIVDEDLYIPTKPFVYAEADPYAGCALLSLYRLKQEFYGLPEDDKVVIERVKKEATALIGYLHLARYCRNPRCVMYHCNDMSDCDAKTDKFCDNCTRLLSGK